MGWIRGLFHNGSVFFTGRPDPAFRMVRAGLFAFLASKGSREAFARLDSMGGLIGASAVGISAKRIGQPAMG